MRDAFTRDFRLFNNALKILRGLDRHVLVAAGVLDEADRFGWILAREHPETFFRALCDGDEDRVAALWRLIDSRQPAELRDSGRAAA